MASSTDMQTGDESVSESIQEDKPKEQLYKVLVIGDFGVGKISRHKLNLI